jgi:hypothetical protein
MSFASIGLVLVVDQLLLPMFHLGPLPVKISYLLLGVWFADWLVHNGVRSRRRERADFLRFALAAGLIVSCSLAGEAITSLRSPVPSHGEAIRSVLVYALVTLSFGLGLDARSFQPKWLIAVLFVAIVLNLSFVFLPTALPSWLIALYYSQRNVESLGLSGVVDVAGVLNLSRPRGLFSNPNVSALLVNVNALFIHVAWRRRLLAPGAVVGTAVITLPLALTAFLSSRGEFVVAAVLALLNLRLLFRDQSFAKRTRAALVIMLVLAGAVAAFPSGGTFQGPLANLERILRLRTIFMAPSGPPVEGDEDQAEGLGRSLIEFDRARARFATSPIVGTGFSVGQSPPFDVPTRYFHNDWFRLLVTSGLVGFAAMTWLIHRYCWSLGWPTLIPFILPGIVNTFQLNIPAMMFYFFMVGVLRSKLRVDSAKPASAH